MSRTLMLVCWECQTRTSKARSVGDGVDGHEHAFGLFDLFDRAARGSDDVVDGVGDGRVEGVGDVDVETGTADDGSVVVGDAVTDHDDGSDGAGGVDDSVSAAERSAGGADRVQGVGDVRSVVGMFLGENWFGGGCDGGGFVAVHAGDGSDHSHRTPWRW